MGSRIRRFKALLAGLACLLALAGADAAIAAPADPDPPGSGSAPAATHIGVADDDGKGNTDVVAANGGTSPFCERAGLDPQTRRRCENAGSIARAYPFSSYGLDNYIELGVTKPKNFFPSAIQGMGALLWEGLLMAINGVLLILEWAFSLDLVGQAMGDVTRSLADLMALLGGRDWLLIGIAVAGLWGIWNGLVRLRTIQTLGSLLLTLLLMVLALVLISNPRETVGEISALTNEASLGALSMVSQGTIDNPPRAYSKANEKLFDTLVLAPWCGLQFGDVSYCSQRPENVCANDKGEPVPPPFPGFGTPVKCERPFGGRVADAWLSHPAGSNERKALYLQLAQAEPERVRLQQMGGTGSRLGLLALITVGLLGAIALFLYLAIKVMLAAIFTLILLLAAPVMLIVPAFGDAGRNGFLKWGTRLGGAIVAKLVYALFLAVVILMSSVLAGLEGIGWYPKWMLLLVFWWGVFLKRRDLVGFVMPSGGQSLGLSQLYYGYSAARGIGGSAVRSATYLPRRAGRLGASAGRAARSEVGLRRRSRDEAHKRRAQHSLQRRAHGAVADDKARDLRRARSMIRSADSDRRRLPDLRDELRGSDRDLAAAKRERDAIQAKQNSTPAHDPRHVRLGTQLSELNDRIGGLQRRRDGLSAETARVENRLANPDLSWAASMAHRGRSGGPIEVSEGEIRDWIGARERQLAGRHPDFDNVADQQDRELIATVEGEGLSRAARSRSELDLDADSRDIVRNQAREIRRSLRREATRNRRRTGMFRP